MTRFEPAGPLRGSLRPPSDKSISHRAALTAAIGEGETVIEGYLDAADTRYDAGGGGGAGRRGADPRRDRLAAWLGGSGKASWLGLGMSHPRRRPARSPSGRDQRRQRRHPAAPAAGLAGGAAGRRGWTLDGDDSIRRRPVDRIAAPLRLMGADLGAREDRLPPLEIRGTPLRGVAYEMPVASAQVKSCVLFAGLLAEGRRGHRASRERCHTERMLRAAGAEIEVAASDGGNTSRVVIVRPRRATRAGSHGNPCRRLLRRLLPRGRNPGRRQRADAPTGRHQPDPRRPADDPEQIGADLLFEPKSDTGGEPTADVTVRPARLCGTEVGGAEIPLAIDELPGALAACFAEGTTTIRDAAGSRGSDRIETVATALTALGGRVEPTEDGMVIEGGGGLRRRRRDRLPRRSPDRDARRRRRPRFPRDRCHRHGRRRGQLPRLRGGHPLPARRLTGVRETP